MQKRQRGCHIPSTHTHRNPQFLPQKLRSARWVPGRSHRKRGSALLPDKLRRVICTAPLASAGCTNCIPCLENRQTKAAGLAGAREEQRLQQAGMKVSSESLRCQVLRHDTARWRCSPQRLQTTLSPSTLPSLAAACTRTHRHTRTHTHHSLLWVTLAAGLWSNAHAIYTAAHAY